MYKGLFVHIVCHKTVILQIVKKRPSITRCFAIYRCICFRFYIKKHVLKESVNERNFLP